MQTDPNPKYEALARSQQRADCGVRALAVTADIPYEQAEELLCLLGRKPRGGTYFTQLEAAYHRLGYRMQPATMRYRTVKKCLAELPPGGAFLISATRHFLGVRDGVCYDWAAHTGKRVEAVYRIRRSGKARAVSSGAVTGCIREAPSSMKPLRE